MRRTLTELLNMQTRIEAEIEPSELREALVMALEWAAGGEISTSQGLEEFLDERNEAKA